MKFKILNLSVMLGFLLVFSSSIAAAHMEDECGMFGGMGSMMIGGYGMGVGIFSWIISVLVIIALALFIYWLIQQISKTGSKERRKK